MDQVKYQIEPNDVEPEAIVEALEYFSHEGTIDDGTIQVIIDEDKTDLFCFELGKVAYYLTTQYDTKNPFCFYRGE